MRVRDEHKQQAIFEATINLVNEVGFAASSVAKIAKAANVSPATIYIYYENKEDLLISTYLRIKEKMAENWLRNFDDTLPIRDIFYHIWVSMFRFARTYPHYFQYAEQFSNSPLVEQVDQGELDEMFQPLFRVVQRGIEQKIIKDVPLEILAAFLFFPVYTLANKRHCNNFGENPGDIEMAFSLAWDAIKL